MFPNRSSEVSTRVTDANCDLTNPSTTLGDTIWLWWFDRAGTIQSFGLNFIKDFPYFIVLMGILDRFHDADWGSSLVFTPSKTTGKSRSTSYDATLDGPNLGQERKKLTVSLHSDDKPLHLSLSNRGSAVARATTPDALPLSPGQFLLGEEMVAKVYYPDETRTSEADCLTYAYGIAAKEDDEAVCVRGHVPVLLAKGEWTNPSAEAIEEVLGIAKGHGKLRPRRLCILLFPKLRHICELDGERFMKAFFDCFRCKCSRWALRRRVPNGLRRPSYSMEQGTASPGHQCSKSNVLRVQ